LVALHVPLVVTSLRPTCGVPETVGAAVLRTTVSLMWMKPLGHIELALEMVRVS
jgi:hypothetical protein